MISLDGRSLMALSTTGMPCRLRYSMKTRACRDSNLSSPRSTTTFDGSLETYLRWNNSLSVLRMSAVPTGRDALLQRPCRLRYFGECLLRPCRLYSGRAGMGPLRLLLELATCIPFEVCRILCQVNLQSVLHLEHNATYFRFPLST